jgi:putative copper resistance protein D
MLDWAIVAARLLQFICALVLFGLSLFSVYGFQNEYRSAASARWVWPQYSVAIAAAGALLSLFWWVAALATTYFPNAAPFDPSAMWIVLSATSFGRVASLRAGLLVLSIITLFAFGQSRTGWIVQSILGALIVASFAWTGHGNYDSGWQGVLHISADVLHLLSAGVWIGALVALGILILRSLATNAAKNADAVLNGLEQFSGIGPMIVAVLILSGLVNSWFLVGIAQWSALFTTGYGIALTIKLILFGGMLLLAAINRYRLSPALVSDLEKGLSPARVLRRLRVAALTELGLSIIVLSTVALMGTWEPPVAS